MAKETALVLRPADWSQPVMMSAQQLGTTPINLVHAIITTSGGAITALSRDWPLRPADVAREVCVALQAMDNTPRNGKPGQRDAVLACTSASILNSILVAARKGLVPAGEEGALVPRGKTCTFMPMFRGVQKLMLRAGYTAVTFLVKEGDHYSGARQGIRPDGTHYHEYEYAPMPFDKRGAKRRTLGAVCVVLDPAGKIARVREVDQEEMERAKAAGNSMLWGAHLDPMWLKTAIHRAGKEPLPQLPDRRAMPAIDAIERENALLTDAMRPLEALPESLTAEVVEAVASQIAADTAETSEDAGGSTNGAPPTVPKIGGTHLDDRQREWIRSCTDLDKLTKAKIKFIADAAKHGSVPAEEDVFLFERREAEIKTEQSALEAQAKRAEAAEAAEAADTEASASKASPPQKTLPALSDKAIERMRQSLWSLKTPQEIDDWSAGLTVTPGLAEALAPDIEQHRQKVGG